MTNMKIGQTLASNIERPSLTREIGKAALAAATYMMLGGAKVEEEAAIRENHRNDGRALAKTQQAA